MTGRMNQLLKQRSEQRPNPADYGVDLGRPAGHDRGYDTNDLRAAMAERNVWANIPPGPKRKGSFAFCRWVYRQRNLVERFINRSKQFRGIATHYDKPPVKRPPNFPDMSHP